MEENGVMKEEKELPIEEAFERLDRICEKLEDPQTSLEDAFAAYQEGMKLVRDCSDKIDLTEKKVMQLMQEGDMHEF